MPADNTQQCMINPIYVDLYMIVYQLSNSHELKYQAACTTLPLLITKDTFPYMVELQSNNTHSLKHVYFLSKLKLELSAVAVPS